MSQYLSSKNKLIKGDSTDKLKKLKDNSVDLLCTDPPYGYSFMGKEWDKVLPDIEIFKEAFRTLKPGAFAFVMSAPRSDVQYRMAQMLDEVGFEIGYTPIYWTYACLSEDTEVFTKSGWKRLHKSNLSLFIDRQTEILIYDKDNDAYRWEVPDRWNVYNIQDTIYRIKSDFTDQLVTKDHRVLIEQNGKLVFQKVQEIGQTAKTVYVDDVHGVWNSLSTPMAEKKTNEELLWFQMQWNGEGEAQKQSSERKGLVEQTLANGVGNETEEEVFGNVQRGKQSVLAWGSNDLQEQGQLQGGSFGFMSTRVLNDETAERLHIGTQVKSGTRNRQTTNKNRNGTSHRSQFSQQRNIQSDVIQEQQRTQTLRGGKTYKTTLATITEEWYEGIVSCPTVSTTSFVARRNGQVFVTGNTGFPKAMNIGKAVDKRGGRFMGDFIEHAIETAEKKGITKKELTMLFPSKTGKPTGWLWNKQKTQGLTVEQFNKLVDYLDLSGYEFLQEAKREIIGTKSSGLGSGKTYAFTDDNDKSKGDVDITIPKTDKAKELDGSYAGYQPKPAVEVVIVAMKPLEKKGYIDQALDNGKGITWLDSCRIPFAGMNDEDEEHYMKAKGNNKENYTDERGWDQWGLSKDYEKYKKDNVGSQENFDTEPKGLSRGNQPSRKKGDTYERVSAFGDTEQSETKDGRNLWGKKATKKVKITKRQPRTDHNVFKQSGFKSEENDTAEASPLGRFAANLLVSDDVLKEDFSRYYSLDAWWRDRFKRLPEEIQRTFPFLVVPKASKGEKNMGLDKFEVKQKDERTDIGKGSFTEKGLQPGKNIHPTVKPIDLMNYLVTLGSRKNDVVLDPFMGSGTTPMACVTLSRNYIGIEREDEYFKIAEARVNKLENPIKQWEQWI